MGNALGGKRQAGFIPIRGISFYRDKVSAAIWDGRLIAIDAKAGK